MSLRSIVVLAALVAMAAAVALWWTVRPVTVAAVQLTTAPLVRTLQFSARVATRSRVDVGSVITGRVAEVLVSEGAQVRRGDPLLRLDRDELQAALLQAQAAQVQAQARVEGLRGTTRRAVQASVAQAQSVLAAAQADLERTRTLVDQGFLSTARLDEAQRAVAVASAQRDLAVAQRDAVADGGADLAQAQAQLVLARAAVEAARARLAQAEIAAPADATVLSRLVEPGQIVQPGRALLQLALSGPLELVAQVDERYLQQLRTGQSARVVADAYPDQPFAAAVRSISPLVDAQRGAVDVKFLPSPPWPDFLREDMTLSVTVETARRDRALAVPMAAVHERPGQSPRVQVAQDGRAVTRAVRTGLSTLEAVEVLDGLAAGDVVLLGPLLPEGQRVRPDFDAAAVQSAAGAATREDAGSAMTRAMGR